eukprot:gene6949-26806_t
MENLQEQYGSMQPDDPGSAGDQAAPAPAQHGESETAGTPKATSTIPLWPAAAVAPPPPAYDPSSPPLTVHSLHVRLDTVETLLANAESLETMIEMLNASLASVAELRVNVELDLLKQAGPNTTNNFLDVDSRLRWLEGAVQPLAVFVLDFTRYMKSAGDS